MIPIDVKIKYRCFIIDDEENKLRVHHNTLKHETSVFLTCILKLLQRETPWRNLGDLKDVNVHTKGRVELRESFDSLQTIYLTNC